jgi:hypothetical protein
LFNPAIASVGLPDDRRERALQLDRRIEILGEDGEVALSGVPEFEQRFN